MSYRKIGDLIQLVDVRNKDLSITHLVGLTINKKFIPSVANTIGTDMSNYKIIRKNQFACSTMQVRRDKKMPVALLKEFDVAIISQAYPVFELIDENEILPEYLMLWFTRSEFDREACFNAVGGVRGSLEWEDFCNMELPVPSIEKQREIVAQYQAVEKKIKVNEQICEKLEATAQTLYKQWFVDFEFPFDFAQGKPNDEGKPYKSSGGAMVYNQELEKEIPEGWEVGRILDLDLDISDGNYSGKYPKANEFFKEGIEFVRGVDFKNKTIDPSNLIYISAEKHKELKKGHLKENDILITTRGASIGKFAFVTERYIGKNLNSQLIRINGRNTYNRFFLGCLINTKEFKNLFESYSTGSAQPQLPIKNFIDIQLIIPNEVIVKEFDKYNSLLNSFLIISLQNQKLTQLQSLLLSRLATLEG